jgi:RNA polymerase sigma-70 factor, ECF subfamily
MEGRSPLPDAELVAAVATGDVEAFAVLYDRYAQAVYRAAFRRLGDRQVAEEVLQDTYLALWNRAELFDASAGSLLVWLSTIARNRAVDRLRAFGRRPAAVPLSAVAPADDHDGGTVERTMARAELLGSGPRSVDPEQALEDAGLRAEIREAIGTIPRLERQVIELAYFEELTQSEIAARLGWPLGTVKTRTRRALGRLREVLAERFGADLAPRRPVAVAVDVIAEEAPARGARSADGSR